MDDLKDSFKGYDLADWQVMHDMASRKWAKAQRKAARAEEDKRRLTDIHAKLCREAHVLGSIYWIVVDGQAEAIKALEKANAKTEI